MPTDWLEAYTNFVVGFENTPRSHPVAFLSILAGVLSIIYYLSRGMSA